MFIAPAETRIVRKICDISMGPAEANGIKSLVGMPISFDFVLAPLQAIPCKCVEKKDVICLPLKSPLVCSVAPFVPLGCYFVASVHRSLDVAFFISGKGESRCKGKTAGIRYGLNLTAGHSPAVPAYIEKLKALARKGIQWREEVDPGKLFPEGANGSPVVAVIDFTFLPFGKPMLAFKLFSEVPQAT